MTRSLGAYVAAVLLVSGCAKAPQKGGPGLPHPLFTAMPDLVGFSSAVDGSASTDPAGRTLTYQWHFSSVPQGSALTDAAFASGSAAMTTFDPDVGGEYGVTLILTTPDGAINQLTKPVLVPTAPIFYSAGDSDANATTLATSVIRSDGTGVRVLSCPNRFDLGATNNTVGGKPAEIQVLISGLAGIRAWDGATPQVAFTNLGLGTQSNSWSTQLFVATDQSDCNTRPALRIDMSAALGSADWTFFFPRFSPDGKRIAALAIGSTMTSSLEKLITVGADGSNFRVVRNFPTSNDQVIAPAWADNANVAWYETVGTANPAEFRIMKAADAVNAGDTAATTLIDCPAGSPFPALSEFDFAGPTTIIFAASTIANGNNMPSLTSLYRESVGSCSTANKLTKETSAGQFSSDFTLSPDGKTIVFASTQGNPPVTTQGAQLTDIFTVPVDGSAPPTRVGGDPTLIDTSPRFIANGRQIVWTQLSAIALDGGSSGNGSFPTSSTLMMANADGTHVRTLVAGVNKPGEVHYAMSGASLGNNCAIGGDAASAGAFVVLALALVAAFARRRARR
jgi:MYXO-CTERM domain-containing protein